MSSSTQTTEHSSSLTSILGTSTFSFTAPLPGTKQRRVSLALPSSPRQVPAWTFRDDTGVSSHVAETTSLSSEPSQATSAERKGKMRKIDPDDEEIVPLHAPLEKKQRKKWTTEETQMLVDGCNIHGVGNWKQILRDPQFKFDNRSPVDLKDRFRTYFPDAYKKHYPNAKTHLSSKVRSTLPDGSPLFEKTRSKKRRPFTEEEDRALKAGYEIHGTVWAAIARDPIFVKSNRRSTDLRDRFRNAYPDLYEAAGYKPRMSKKAFSPSQPIRAVTDDVLQLSSEGTTRKSTPNRRRANTTQGWLRGGTKSVPDSLECTEDDESSAAEDDPDISINESDKAAMGRATTPQPENNQTVVMNTRIRASPEFVVGSSQQSVPEAQDSSVPQPWSPQQIDNPEWMVGSPGSSHLSTDALPSSPYHHTSNSSVHIGKSAWATHDWFSSNPRMDPSASSASPSSYVDDAYSISPATSSPFSIFHTLHPSQHNVMDRYDLFPASMSYPHDISSEIGFNDTHSAFSDPEAFAPTSFRGFTHHSNYAGDLIFGARTHQPVGQPDYGLGFGFGVPSANQTHDPSMGIHPMQLHTPSLPDIDEVELTGITDITLDDHDDVPALDLSSLEKPPDTDDLEGMSSSDVGVGMSSQGMHEFSESHDTPPATPLISARPMRTPSQTHLRSISVPPSEHRVPMPPRASDGHPPTHMLSRSISFFDSMYHPPPGNQHQHQPQTQMQGQAVMAVQQQQQQPVTVDPRVISLHPQQPSLMPTEASHPNLPFLDLHYFYGSAGAGIMDDTLHKSQSDAVRQQALDLAQLHANPHVHQHMHSQPLSPHVHPLHSPMNSIESQLGVTSLPGSSSSPSAIAAAASLLSNSRPPIHSSVSLPLTGANPSSLPTATTPTASIAPPPPPTTAPPTTTAAFMSPPAAMRMPPPSFGTAMGKIHHHQRRQSAVESHHHQIIFANNVGENKRKRASWDAPF